MKITADLVPFIDKITIDLFENHIFLFLEETPVEEIDPSSEMVQSVIDFEGPVNGRLYVISDIETARTVAANLLGTDPDSPDADRLAIDAMAETANMLCGHIIDELCDRASAEGSNTTDAEQHIPKAGKAGEEEFNKLAAMEVKQVFLTDEDGVLLIGVEQL